ncbi:PAS domain S-box protein [candidate division KSB1 bacterium]|nr:PAS domain S-box protein [candidate division KSB1 bacterium]
MKTPKNNRININVESFLDIAGVMFIVLDKRGIVSLVNEKGCEILGYPENAIIGKNWFDTFLPEDLRSSFKEVYSKIMQGKIQPVEFYENPVLVKGGGKKMIHWHNTPLWDENGRIIGTLSSGEDVSDKKRLEEKSNHLYHVLQAIRNINQLITREKDKKRLIQESCQLLTETRGYNFAWIILFDGKKDILMTGHSGLETLDPTPMMQQKKQLPYCVREALNRKKVTITDKNHKDCGDCPLVRIDSECRVMTVPIEYRDKLYGLLLVCVPREIVIDQDEQNLLEELTGDIGFALQTIDNEASRLAMEEKLRNNEQFLQNVFDAIQDGISVLDTDLNIVRINRWMEKMYDHRAPIVGQKCYYVYQKRTSPCSFCPTKLTIQTGKPQSEIVPYPNEVNPVGWIDLSVFPIMDNDGRVVHLIEYVKDITEQKRAEQALRDSELRYRTLFDSANDAIFLIDEDKYVGCNNATVHMFGCNEKRDIIGRSPWDFSPAIQPDGMDSKQKTKKIIKMAQVGDIQPFYWQHQSVNGKPLDTQVSLNKLTLDGKLYLQAIVRDITEQNQARLALKESVAMYRSLIENSNDAIYLLYNRKFEIINQKFEEMMGITLQDVQQPDFNMMTLIKPSDRVIIEQREQDIKNGKSVPPQYQFTILRPDGRDVIVEASVSYIPYKDGLATQGILRDMTERIRTENQIRQSLREKEVLLQEVHHRVKNNLNVITSLLTLQAMQLGNKEQAINAFKKTKDRIFAMAMVHEKLYQSGVYTEIDMNDYTKTLVKNLLSIYNPEAKIHYSLKLDNFNLDINRAIPCGLILNELITNALKHAFYGQSSGKLTISFRKHGPFELVVKDSGIGLQTDSQDWNADTLGMQLINILTAQLDGKLTIKIKEGTEFKIVFPVRKNDKAPYR